MTTVSTSYQSMDLVRVGFLRTEYSTPRPAVRDIGVRIEDHRRPCLLQSWLQYYYLRIWRSEQAHDAPRQPGTQPPAAARAPHPRTRTCTEALILPMGQTGSARARRPGESGQHTSRDERPHYLIRRMTRATTIATPTNATMVPKWMQGSTIRRRCSTRMT